ncbi:MAG: hypothetical protein F4Z04_06420 [Acidobacteria bacterium]|nr:hypothetical protein [Acidobacteriota bacterium]
MQQLTDVFPLVAPEPRSPFDRHQSIEVNEYIPLPQESGVTEALSAPRQTDHRREHARGWSSLVFATVCPLLVFKQRIVARFD